MGDSSNFKPGANPDVNHFLNSRQQERKKERKKKKENYASCLSCSKELLTIIKDRGHLGRKAPSQKRKGRSGGLRADKPADLS